MAFEYRLDSGAFTTRSIDFAGDRDSFETTFIKGLTYSARASGSYTGAGTLADPNLTLTDSQGRTLLFDDDIVNGTNRDAQLTFKINASGTYGLTVGEQGDNATGSYRLEISTGFATNASETITGTGFADAIGGLGGNDVINGGGGNDKLLGGTGNDSLLGATGSDRLFGEVGNDLLRGGDLGDVLTGGAGADRLIGGAGGDRFVFNFASDSTANASDVIVGGDGGRAMDGVGQSGGDVIDLTGIDANEFAAGNQAFAWSTAKTAGTLYLAESNGSTILYGHTDNDRVADFRVVIGDGAMTANMYTSDEFIL